MIVAAFRKRRKYPCALGVLLLAASWMYFFFPGPPTLTVVHRNGETQETVAAIPVTAGSRFTIQYIHSVDRLPVHETFLVNDEYSLLLSEFRFITLGAGMGDSGGDIVYDGRWTVVENIRKELTSFHLRVSSITEQTLLIGDREIKLAEIAPESGLLKFEVRRSPRAYLMLRGGC
ncbi:DUF1850 domain-containing protein [Dehalococcoidia bacterium]|nr:DUF1850 domain-containing protein [Dehalococcoidia bacterium]